MTTKLSKAQQAERDAAIMELRSIFPPNSTVSVVLRHVSRSGMERAISVISPDLRDVSWLVARATGFKMHGAHEGLKVGGCGMDMGFHVVYSLSRTLYGAEGGYTCNGIKPYDANYNTNANYCRSNDHVNERGASSNYTPGRVHSDGGYALSSRWL
jgi:hypothetical protein